MSSHSRLVPITVYLFLGGILILFALKHYIIIHSSTGFEFDEVEQSSSMPRVNTVRTPTSKKNIQVLVLVSSLPHEYKLRAQIRASWANSSNLWQQQFVRVEFFMGRAKSQKAENVIIAESEEFDDIIITDMEENYYNLAVKTFSMLAYKAENYKDTKCMVKADIDNVLFLDNFVRLCEETVAPAILGKCDISRRVQRTITKWAVPKKVWPYETYPPYCSTGTYVIAGSYVPKLLVQAAFSSEFATSANFRKLPEDVIFTGILAEIINVRRRHVGGITFTETPQFVCRNGIEHVVHCVLMFSGYRHTYSLHMIRRKDHTYNYERIMQGEGKKCHLWDVLPIDL